MGAAEKYSGAIALGGLLFVPVGFAVLLQPSRPQPANPVFFDEFLPGIELFFRQIVAFAGICNTKQSAAYGGDNFGLAAHHPSCCAAGREVGQSHVAASGPDDGFDLVFLFFVPHFYRPVMVVVSVSRIELNYPCSGLKYP